MNEIKVEVLHDCIRNANMTASSSRVNVTPLRIDKGQATILPSTPNLYKKRVRDNENDDLVLNELRGEALSGNLSL